LQQGNAMALEDDDLAERVAKQSDRINQIVIDQLAKQRAVVEDL
jgi:hypothetical protein